MTHGTLGLGSSWTRALFPGELRTEVEALIPAGFRINVTAVNGRPGPWRVEAFRTGESVAVLTWTTHNPRNGVRVMAEHLHEKVVA